MAAIPPTDVLSKISTTTCDFTIAAAAAAAADHHL